MSALFAFVGVLVGVGLASGYNFWAIRRAELERAVVAGMVIGDELKVLSDALRIHDSPTAGDVDGSAVTEAWHNHRQALVVYVPEARWIEMAELIRRTNEARRVAADEALVDVETPSDARVVDSLAADVEAAWAWLASRTAELRASHQAFILTPLFRYLRTKPWRRGREPGP